MSRVLALMLLGSFLVASPTQAVELPKATPWTLINTLDAWSLSQAVDVQKEVKLSPKQARQMQELVEVWRKKNQAFRKANRRPSPADCQQQYQAMLEESKTIASPEQLKRLRQIQFQCDGVPAVMVNHENSDALFKLSAQQRSKLIEIDISSEKMRADAFTKRMTENKNPLELFKEGGAAETKWLQAKNKQALDLLQPSQRQAWETLIGKPFKGRLTTAKGKKVHSRLEALN